MRRWFISSDDNLQDRVLGAIMSVTLIGVSVVWVGALVLLVENSCSEINALDTGSNPNQEVNNG